MRLDGEEVPNIDIDLEPYGQVKGRPKRLTENRGTAFNGSKVLGQGFILSDEERDELLQRNQINANVIQPYVTGRDLNQRPDCSASRWIINFRGWTLEQAEEYPDCIGIVRRLVKPKRDTNKRQQRRERWWVYAERAPELYQAIDDLKQVLAISIVSNAIMPVRVPASQVFSHACAVFALEDFASLAILSSSVHSTWVTRFTSTMRTDIRYAPSDVFLTLPRPKPTPELEPLGRQLDETRSALMKSRAWGLTAVYNRVRSPDIHEPAIQKLRDIHVAIDEAVMRAYGWNDLDLKIGHHPTKIGVRWTVSKEVRFELLDRLLEENHKRYEAEQQ